MDSILSYNKVNVPLGFKVGVTVISKSGNTYCSDIYNGPQKNKFLSFFNEDDLDFVLDLDNRSCSRGVRVTITINGQNYSFYVPSKKFTQLKTLENKGRKLHFKSQETVEGQTLVAATANKYGISYDSASINCSKIKFSIEIEKHKENVKGFGLFRGGRIIELTIEDMFGKKVPISIGNEETVKELKKRYAEEEGISEDMALIFNSRVLDNNEKVKSIDYGSTIIATNLLYDLSQPLFPGQTVTDGGFPTRIKRADGSKLHCLGVMSGPSSNLSVNDGKNSLGFDSEKPDCLCGPSNFSSGSRGVICYGEKSNQSFSTHKGFEADYYLLVNDFEIELRMASTCIPI